MTYTAKKVFRLFFILLAMIAGTIILSFLTLIIASRISQYQYLKSFCKKEALEREDCLTRGGEWGASGPSDKYSCYGLAGGCAYRTKDFGKPCTSGKDCEGRCELPDPTSSRSTLDRKNARCAEWKGFSSCVPWHIDDNGKVQSGYCT